MTTTAIQKAAQAAGGQSALARKIGCTPQAVQRWCKTGFVPADRVVAVEQAVEGAVSRNELRPDLYVPAVPAEQAAA